MGRGRPRGPRPEPKGTLYVCPDCGIQCRNTRDVQPGGIVEDRCDLCKRD